jgi:hypothetical protein
MGTTLARYFLHLLIAVDQLGTTLIGGYPDETLSSYAYRMDLKGTRWGRFWRPVIDWVFTWQGIEGGHCKAAWMEERARYQEPPELR